MRHTPWFAGLSLLAGSLLTGGCAAPAGAQTQPTGPQAERLAALRDAGPQAKLILYPVAVGGAPNRNVADALGLVLESYGMQNHDTTDSAFTPPKDAEWDAIGTAFAAFIKEHQPAGDYALYAEYLGTPKTGPKEVRWLIVTAAGDLVCSDRQTPADADFKRTAARDPDPMGCSVLVAERVFSQLHWKKAAGAGGEPRGKFAQRWAEKSGTPSEAEQAAIKDRLAKLKGELKNVRLSVLPTRALERHDAESAARLAAEITKQMGWSATVAAKPATMDIKPTSNQQKHLWDVARGVRAHVRANPPDTDYVLLADYLIAPNGGPVRGTFFVVCDKAGEWVIVDFQNNQWPDFQAIAPQSVEDCDRLTLRRLAGCLK